jgi:hypothetical protein
MTFLRIVKSWLPLACAISVMSLTIDLAVQQNFRMSANDPQIQIAEDAARSIGSGTQNVPAQPAANPVDIAASLAPFSVFYDDQGRPISGTGMLNGKLPSLPAGIFEFVRQNGEERVTWQPRPGVRSAIVVERIRGGGFVMAGRSLREVELRERNLDYQCLLGGGGALFGSLLLVIILDRFGRPNQQARTASLAA